MKIMMLILTFNLFLSFCFAVYNSIVTAYEKFVFQKILAIIQSLLKPVLMIPLLFMGYKSITLCIVITTINIITILSNYIYCKKKLKIDTRFKGFDKKLFKVVIGYSIWIFVGVVVDKINWSVDNFILGAVSGTIAVSVYSIAATLNQLFVTLSTAISGILLPKMSKMIAKNASDEKITNEFIKVGRIQYFIIFLMASGLILVGKEFFRLWAGTGYEDAYYIALLLILPVCIPLIQNLGISIRQAMNKHRFSAIVNIVVAILNVCISIVLARKYGAIGAAFGTSVSIIVSCFINNIYYYREIRINIPKFWKEILKLLLVHTTLCVLMFLLKRFIIINNLSMLAICCLLYTIIYSLITYYICMNSYEKGLVNRVLIKLKVRK